MRTLALLLTLFVSLPCLSQSQPQNDKAQKAAAKEQRAFERRFQIREVMVPMRDGVRLQTVIISPRKQTKPLPILLRRTPYGVPADLNGFCAAPSCRQLMADGYIVAVQNLRGRFKSEGQFLMATTVADDAMAADEIESRDAYDTIEWLLKNVPNHNGKVGMTGGSYDALTAMLALLDPHPALKAISEQASPSDPWMNDDFFHYGAFRLSYGFEYSIMEEAASDQNTHFKFDVYDTYDWYLRLGPLTNVNAKYLHGKIPSWNGFVAHPNYDDHWKRNVFVNRIKGSPVPNLNVAGWWDQEDPWGPWHIYKTIEKRDSERNNFIVAGPWFHGGWGGEGAKLEQVTFGGHKTGLEYSNDVLVPWFRYWLHGKGERFTWDAKTFQTGSNTWKEYASWPPPQAQATPLYLHADGSLSFEPERADGGYREYVSDPANPVPYRQRPISPTYPGGDWRTWEAQDQRFVDRRPDVLTYTSAPLEQDVTVTGDLSALLYASTSGTDSDWVVKLIDVHPEDHEVKDWGEAGPAPGEYAKSLNGYQLMIASEVIRGRFHKSFEEPEPLVPNEVTRFEVPLRSHDHVFKKGHRIMVQVQSTWFPLIDRNPQKFVPNIFEAKAEDYIKATQRIYSTPQSPSQIILPVVK